MYLFPDTITDQNLLRSWVTEVDFRTILELGCNKVLLTAKKHLQGNVFYKQWHVKCIITKPSNGGTRL